MAGRLGFQGPQLLVTMASEDFASPWLLWEQELRSGRDKPPRCGAALDPVAAERNYPKFSGLKQ